jgi:hypothetical protein
MNDETSVRSVTGAHRAALPACITMGFQRVFPWLLAGGLLGFLLQYEEDHSRDAYWWTGVVGLNTLALAIAAAEAARRRAKFPLRALIAIQSCAIAEALAIRWLGTSGLLLIYFSAMGALATRGERADA